MATSRCGRDSWPQYGSAVGSGGVTTARHPPESPANSLLIIADDGGAAARKLAIAFSVADMRGADRHHGSGFDVVLSAGNAIPHLLSDDEIEAALRAMHGCLRMGGGCIITILPRR